VRPSSVAVSIVTHAAVLLALVIVPLFAVSDMPPIQQPIPPFMPAYRAGAVPSEPPAADARSPSKRTPNPVRVPVEAPRGIHSEKPVPPVVRGLVAIGGIEAGTVPGLPSGFGIDATFTPPPPPPPRSAPAPVRPGGRIKVPARVEYVAPAYPAIAQSASVEGVVILEATIDVDGRVQDVRVLRSYPLLDQAAIDAVQRWRYTPTLLNGVPIPVLMTVTVSFRLNR
jgi:protein TonB